MSQDSFKVTPWGQARVQTPKDGGEVSVMCFPNDTTERFNSFAGGVKRSM